MFIKKREVYYRNIKTEFEIKLRMNKSIKVEKSFEFLKSNYKLNRFLTREIITLKLNYFALFLLQY